MADVAMARQFGSIVRKYRKELGLTQRELAEKAHVSERLVISLELGEASGIRVDKLSQVLKVLGLALFISESLRGGQRKNSYPEAKADELQIDNAGELEKYDRAFDKIAGRLCEGCDD